MLLTENISALNGCSDCPEIGIIKAVHILKRVLLFSCCLFAVFPAADELRYRAHRAINAPGTRLEQQQRNDTENAGGQHDTVKSKSKLRDPWLRTAAVSPVPGYVKSPQQADCLMKIDSMGKDQVGRNQHIDKHRCKKQQEAITEGM